MMGGSTTRNVEQFPAINKLFNIASCWIYIGILLGTHAILHINRIMVKFILDKAMKTDKGSEGIALLFL
jgi:hypothetical protein